MQKPPVEAAERAMLTPEEEDGAERKEHRHYEASWGEARHQEASAIGMC